MKKVLPKDATWLKDRVSCFDPINGSVQTESGGKISYDVIILALGLELHYDKVRIKINWPLIWIILMKLKYLNVQRFQDCNKHWTCLTAM